MAIHLAMPAFLSRLPALPGLGASWFRLSWMFALSSAVAVYLNALDNPFVYDDYRTVVSNGSLGDPTNLRRLLLHDVARPLTNISFAVDRWIWGSNSFGFHLTGVLLHAANVLLLCVWVDCLGRDSGRRTEIAPFAAGVVLAVHPLMVEAVGYISGRSEVLCGMLVLAAMLSGRRWLMGGSGSRRWGAATLVLWALALASKETAAVLPLLLLVYDWSTAAHRPGELTRRIKRIHLPLLAAATAAAALRVALLAVVEFPGAVQLRGEYAWVALDGIMQYLLLFVGAARQTIFHAVPAHVSALDPRALAAVLTVAGMLVLMFACRPREPRVALGLAWFMVALAPSSVLIALGRGEPLVEHRVYIAGFGLCIVSGIVIDRINVVLRTKGLQARALGAAAFALVWICLSAATIARNALWSDPVALWRESVELAPDHHYPRLLLGEALQTARRYPEAAAQYLTAIELRPDEPLGYVKLALCLAELGRFAEARGHLNHALALDPGNADARDLLTRLDELERSNPEDVVR